jgi:hypothetical protein
MSFKYKEIKALSLEELKEKFDTGVAKGDELGGGNVSLDFLYREINRRENAELNNKMVDYTHKMVAYTRQIRLMTLIMLLFTIVSAFSAIVALLN